MKKKITSQFFLVLFCLLPLASMAQPDLVISNLELTDIKGNSIAYTYQITNIGQSPAPTIGITVQAYISSDHVFSPETDIRIDERGLDASPIQPDQTITRSATVTLQQYDPIKYPYLTMKIDGQEVLEEEKEGNNFAWTGIVTPPQPPLLTEEAVSSQIIIPYYLYTPAQLSIIQAILVSFGGVEVDHCNCERSISVWQFGSEQQAQDAMTEIDTKESLETVADVDGGNKFIELKSRTPLKGFELLPETVPPARQDILVYLIDSGLNTDYLPNENNLPNPAPTYSCSDAQSKGYNYQDPLRVSNSDFEDENGHGTFGFRAITRGLSKRIQVVPIKVFDDKGQGTVFGMVCAIYHAIDNGAHIINISAGYQGEENSLLRAAVEEARNEGVFIITAAGNDDNNIDIEKYQQYPAYYAKDFANVISIASQNLENDKLGKCSNYGKQSITMSAPGEKICGYNHKGQKVILSGTSVAAFYVTRNLAIQLSQQTSGGGSRVAIKNEFLGRQRSGCLSNETKEGKCLKVNSSPCRLTIFEWVVQLFD